MLLVTDPKLTTVAAWGRLIPGGEEPEPTTYIIGADGNVRWRFLARGHEDWPAYADVAAALP